MLLPEYDTHFDRYVKKGYYQRGALFLAMSTVRRWGTAVDVGGHVGFISRDMAHFFDAVYAFEPQPDNFRCLVENVPKNVHARNVALGDRPMMVGIHTPEPTNSGAWELCEGNSVLMRTLDSFELQDVGLIKIDVQGFEFAVLKGAIETLMKWKPAMLVEFPKADVERLKQEGETSEAMQWLVDLGAIPRHVVSADVVFSWG